VLVLDGDAERVLQLHVGLLAGSAASPGAPSESPTTTPQG
jgi:hypothetical protein